MVSYLTEHDAKGKDVHSLIIALPWKGKTFLFIICVSQVKCKLEVVVVVCHTMNHLWSHPVGVSHHSVPLPAVRFLQARQLSLRQFLLMLVVHHKPSQPEVCHHHRVVLKRRRTQYVVIMLKSLRSYLCVRTFKLHGKTANPSQYSLCSGKVC